jgi:hypothetical protein
MKSSIIIFAYNSLKDPLFYGTVMSYVKEINLAKEYTFHVITYEQEKYKLSPAEFEQERKFWLGYNVHLHPLKWSDGKFKLLYKIKDLIKGYFLINRIKRKNKAIAILTLGNIAGAYAYMITKLIRLKLILFTYEPHSEFMADCGVWSKRSFKYKALNYLEGKMGIKADYVATGTSHMIERLKREKSTAKLYRIPSCIDSRVFQFSETSRTQIRKGLGWANNQVFVYAGKFGDLYYKDEIASVCVAIRHQLPESRFLILTPNKKEEVESMFQRSGMKPENMYVDFIPYHKMPEYLSAADFGIVGIAPLPSQKYRSPIKVGEYLCTGLPYIVCKGISEDDTHALQFNVGVVLNEFTQNEVNGNIEKIKKLLIEPKEVLRERCRKSGILYRDQEIAVKGFTEIFESL